MMNEQTRDAAVQIVRSILGDNAPPVDQPIRTAVDALAREYEFCPPGTLARVAALEAVVAEARRVAGWKWCPERHVPLIRALAALDAAPAAREGE
jgi:hypothetical protein